MKLHLAETEIEKYLLLLSWAFLRALLLAPQEIRAGLRG